MGAIQALLMLSVGVLFGAFVILPLNSLKKTTPLWLAVALTALGVLAAKFHYLARPEIFSYMFEGLMLTCLTEHRLKAQNSDLTQKSKLSPSQIFADLDFGFIAAVIVIFILWCNFHSGFIFGAVLLATYSASSLLVAALSKNSRLVDFSAIVAAVLLPLAAFINPFGIRLLVYLKEQLWFDPFLNTIGEMTPIVLTNPVFAPFFVLIFVFVILLLLTLRKTLAAGQKAFFLLTSLCIVVPPIVVAFEHRRLILFAVLVMLFESTVLMSQWRGITSEQSVEPQIDANLNQSNRFWRLPAPFLPVLVSMISVPLAFAWFGCDNRWDVHVLSVVDKGIAFVRDNAQDRRIFNDFMLGDRMIWMTPEHPRVFLDTRYDMYGSKLVDEYDVISMGQPGWQNVLDKYKVEMVCFFVKSRIADLLREEPEWKMVYSDSRTIVFERTIEKVLGK